MNAYSPVSEARLDTCHKDHHTIFNAVLPYFDHSILCGHRGETDQNRCFFKDLSKCKWPDSEHNSTPSMAVDAGPYDRYIKSVDYKDIERLNYFAGFVMATAGILYREWKISHILVWGGDWDGDTDLKDNVSFRDLVHFELRKPRDDED